ncbi:MAG: hypothetical protein ACI4PO_09095 [Faecousia sp.]
MASNKEKTVAEAVKETPVVRARVNESVYSAEELAENHKLFKTSYEIVEIALRLAGKKEATYSEAKAIIEEFKKREVK